METLKISELDQDESHLLGQALKAREFSYSPYSGFKVGSAVVDKYGEIFTGCNIESADFTLTTHAEMCAIDKMVSSGSKKIAKIAIVFEETGKPVVPCGLCRQKISEFADGKVAILGASVDGSGELQHCYRFLLEELIPFTFSSNYLKTR